MKRREQKNLIPAWFRYPNYHWGTKHAVIIGAGIAGCQTAWHLVKQGWHVTLIEREKKIAQQASGNPAGIISPKMTAQASNGEDFYVECFDYAVQQLSDLKTRHHKLDWHACGLLQLAHNDREEKRWGSLKERDFDKLFLQCVDKNEATGIAGIPIDYKASYFPQAGWINPVSFCNALLADCGDDCQVILESDVINLEKEQNKWQLLDKYKQTIASAEVVIIASGKDLNTFPQSNQLPSMPVKGQTTSVASNDFSKQLKTTIGHDGYLTPASDITSKLTFGASFDRNISQAHVDKNKDNENLDQLRKYLPQLADSFEKVNSAHVAIRMTTPDRFPYFGGIADKAFFTKNYADLHQGKQFKDYPKAKYIEGLFVLAGLGSRGLTTSGLCAKHLVNILESNEQNEAQSILQNCHPARFIIKDLKRNIYS